MIILLFHSLIDLQYKDFLDQQLVMQMIKELNLSVPVYSIFCNKMSVQSVVFPSHSTSQLP